MRFLLTCSLFVAVLARAEVVPRLFSTGVDANGELLTSSALDPHWHWYNGANGVSSTYVVANEGFPAWPAQGPNSQWIAPHANQQTGEGQGGYIYRTSFDLTGFDLASASLRLAMAADDYVYSVRLNGTDTRLTFPYTPAVWVTNTIATGFYPGLNIMDVFVMNSSGGPSGLRCEPLLTATSRVLTSRVENTNLVLSWATNLPCYRLESTTNLASGPWATNASALTMTNGCFAAAVPLETASCFYRLSRPPGLPPSARIVVNRDYGEGYTEVVHLAPEYTCDIGAGCQLQWPLDGTITNTFDAFECVEQAGCSTNDPSLRFHWEFRFPPLIQGGQLYAARGITGYRSPVLTIAPNSFPALSGVDVHWRAILTITSGIDPTLEKVVLFRFQYDSSETSLSQIQSCRGPSQPGWCSNLGNASEVLPGTDL
jgi:hypothetical protein